MNQTTEKPAIGTTELCDLCGDEGPIIDYHEAANPIVFTGRQFLHQSCANPGPRRLKRKVHEVMDHLLSRVTGKQPN